MTRTIMVLISVLLASGLLLADAAPTRQETGFLNRHLTFAGKEYSYQVYVPANWTPAKKWPVILFLHGYGESGDDGLASTDVGIGSAIRMTPGRFPFVVVFPQCPWQHWWANDDMARMALATLDAEVKEFNGDPDRLYLTGLSMGGYGTWYIASHFHEKFAAVAPVCGGLRNVVEPKPQSRARNL
jgi:predicted peptidase